MKINLIAIGNKMPNWVTVGFNEYQKRLNQDIRLNLLEIPALKRNKNVDINRIIEKEGELLLSASEKSKIITLDLAGQAWNTEQLALQIQQWKYDGRDISMLIGGPEGLSQKCKQHASQSWALSNLTLPHPLVRIVVAESLYRAWSLINNHPYHRE